MWKRKTYKGIKCRQAEISSKKKQSGLEGDLSNIHILSEGIKYVLVHATQFDNASRRMRRGRVKRMKVEEKDAEANKTDREKREDGR
jgi:hypothetical protein